MALVDYEASDDDERPVKVAVNTAPNVSIQDPMQQSLVLSRDSEKMLSTNISYDDMSRPAQGPANPYNSKSLVEKNIITGHAEVQAYNDTYFRQQHQNFNSTTNGKKRKREGKGDVTQLYGDSAWKGPWAKYDQDLPSDVESIVDEYEPEVLAPKRTPIVEDTGEIRVETHDGAERSEFYGKSRYDYLGRTYLHVPQDLDIDLRRTSGEQDCFVPKKLIHTWEGHQKAVSALRFFPKSGHLLLSASMDSKIMLWDCYHDRALLRDYAGHSKAVRDVCFNSDGTRFLSAGYDFQMKLWDTETGQCISHYSNGKIPLAIKIHPEKDEFLAGLSDKKILQYDMKSGEIIQEYNHHLGPVNTVTFIDENRRFVTTSDDKSLRAWEYGIPVPIKLVSEPDMHTMPSVVAHPSGKYVACQSLDNRVVVFSALEKIKAQRRKNFRGHGCGGYNVSIDFSPDGKYLCSGDAGGFAMFWDWKTCKVVSKIEAHKGPLTQIAWHPQETSKVATAGNDCVIKYWD